MIEEFCRKHDSKKSRWLAELVEMSYDLYAELAIDQLKCIARIS